MPFRYTITEEEYKEAARALLNTKNRIVKLVFGAAQFLLVIVLNVTQDVSPWMKWALAGLSLIWLVLTVLQNGLLGLRSVWMMNMLKKNDPSGEYWKEHQLSLSGGTLRLHYGKVTNTLECREISELQRTEHLMLIRSGKMVFDIIPEKILQSEEWPAFLEAVDEQTYASVTKAREEYLEKADHFVYCRMTREEMTERLVDVKRRSYVNGAGWTKRTLLTLGVPLALAVYSAAAGQWVYFGLCLLTFFFFNFGFFMVFLPVYYRYVLNSVDEPTRDGYLFLLAGKELLFFSRRRGTRFFPEKLKKQERKDGFRYLYFEKDSMTFVPESLGRYLGGNGGVTAGLRGKAMMPSKLPDRTREDEEEEKTPGIPEPSPSEEKN